MEFNYNITGERRKALVTAKGTVIGVDDTGSIMVRWDNDSGLNVLYGIDRCRVISE